MKSILDYPTLEKSMTAKKNHGFATKGKVQKYAIVLNISSLPIGLFPNLSEKASLAAIRVYNTLIIFYEKTHLQNKTSKQTGETGI